MFGARLIYVMKNLLKKNNFQTDFLKNKIKIKIWGVATLDFRLILIFFQSPETAPPPPSQEKKRIKDFSKYILHGKIIF